MKDIITSPLDNEANFSPFDKTPKFLSFFYLKESTAQVPLQLLGGDIYVGVFSLFGMWL